MYKVQIETDRSDDVFYTKSVHEIQFPDGNFKAKVQYLPTEHVAPPDINHFDPYHPDDMEAVLVWWLNFCDYTELIGIRKTETLVRSYERIYEHALAYNELSINGQRYFSTRMIHDILDLIGSELDPMEMCLDDWWNS